MKETVNYLCVDDEKDAETLGYLTRIEKQKEGLIIEPRVPGEFAAEVDILCEEIEAKKIKGLIVDLRLNGTKNSPSRYRAPALVQEIHTRVAEGTFPIRPLVLWSNDEKLSSSYWPDDTSHDLFDLTIHKEKLITNYQPYAKAIADKMVALADGYTEIIQTTNTGPARALGLLQATEELATELDPRILQPLTFPSSEVSVYDQARFIHRQLLAIPNNALVNAETLAARLGLRLAEVSDFENLAEQLFPGSRYCGVFSDGWACWWMPLVEEAWLSLSGCPGQLRELTAAQRVACIAAVLDRPDLKPAAPIELALSSSFWVVCQSTRRPLDPLEGYVVDRQLYPWQLTQYISLHGKLDGSKEASRIKIDALDLERYDEDRKTLKQS